MEIQIDDYEGVKVVRVKGRVQDEGEQSFSRAVGSLIQGRGTRIVLDLSQVEMLNSSGLGDWVRLTAQVNTQEGRVILANPSAFVAGVLETTRLDRFFEICSSVDEAVARLR